MTYRVIDLFGGAGGAAMGYHRAGFEVIGVDIEPQPRYPFEFIQADALEFLDTHLTVYDLDGIDAIHASPPCQAYSAMANCRPGLAEKYPKLIEPTRELLQATGLPYVIENVPGSPLKNYGQLCGTIFCRQVEFNGRKYELQRHRWFETNWPLTTYECEHAYPSLPVYGHGVPGNRPDLRGQDFAVAAREAMGIDWMNRDELAESIPPCYTEFVGRQLRAHLESTSNPEAKCLSSAS